MTCARCLVRSLHPQHQIDQFLLRQTLQITAIHIHMDSGILAPDKGVGNYSFLVLILVIHSSSYSRSGHMWKNCRSATAFCGSGSRGPNGVRSMSTRKCLRRSSRRPLFWRKWAILSRISSRHMSHPTTLKYGSACQVIAHVHLKKRRGPWDAQSMRTL